MNFVLTKEQETLEKGLTILLEEHGHAYGEGRNFHHTGIYRRE